MTDAGKLLSTGWPVAERQTGSGGTRESSGEHRGEKRAASEDGNEETRGAHPADKDFTV